jgi:UDP-glucuronate 4-epimerase
MNIIVARLFNVYGPSGRPDMMPLRLMTAAFSGETVKVFNNGDIYRDWTYIDDTAEGIVSALDRPMGYEIINIGCGEPISLREFIAIIEEYAGRPIARVNEPTPPSDPPITFCNNEKARRLLGFNPRTNIRDGLRHTWEWFYEWYTQKVSP